MAVARIGDRPLYSFGEADRLLRLRAGTTSRWLEGYTRAGKRYPPVVRPRATGGQIVTWGEFVELGYLREYRDAGISLQRMRPFIEMLRDEFEVPYPLAAKRPYVSDNRHLVLELQARAELPEGLFMVVGGPEHGQYLLARRVEGFLSTVEFDAEEATAMRPLGASSPVTINPALSFGIPTVRGIRTEILADAYLARTPIDELADDYGLEPQEVDEAIRWELELRSTA